MDSLPLSDRLRRSVAMVGQRMTFSDGRRPCYFGLLDLESKPFWSAEECQEGTKELIEDLKRNHSVLLEEAKEVERLHLARLDRRRRLVFGFCFVFCLTWKPRDQGKVQSNGGWAVHCVTVEGKMSGTCPNLLALLERHRHVVCTREMFSACIISILRPGGKIYPHYGPTNLRLRLQYPLTINGACRLYCGGEERDYSAGYEIIDDSYSHHAKNGDECEESESRIMLIIDLWHPGISSEERECINKLIDMSSGAMGSEQ